MRQLDRAVRADVVELGEATAAAAALGRDGGVSCTVSRATDDVHRQRGGERIAVPGGSVTGRSGRPEVSL